MMVSWYAFYQKNFMENCASFKGRFNRQEYLCRQLLLNLSIFLPLAVLFLMLLRWRTAASLEEVIALWGFHFAWVGIIILLLSFFITMLSLMVRRLHDLDFSGWYVLTILVPILNGLFFFWLACAKGTSGSNAYGTATTAVNQDRFWDDQINRQRLVQKFCTYLTGKDFVKDYCTFKGRLTCREYFFLVMGPTVLYSLLNGGCQVLYFLLVELVGSGENIRMLAVAGSCASIIAGMVLFLLLFTVDVRRSHDHGSSWYYSLLALVPFVNFIYLIRQFCLTGVEHDNQYGKVRTYTDAQGTLYNDDY